MGVNSALLKSNVELRKMARETLKGNWGMAILVNLLAGIILVATSYIIKLFPFGFVLYFIIVGPIALGIVSFFLKLNSNQGPKVGNLFDGFKSFFVSSSILEFFICLFTFLWSLLLIVPGIIALLRYSQAFYILFENPEIGALEAIKQSKKMMQGQKGKLFLLLLSFIGWFILSLITCGIGFFWLGPYMAATLAHFYVNLKEAYVKEENAHSSFVSA